MKKFSLIMLILMLVSGAARAVELMKWERIPLQVPLTVGQERIVFVNKNVRVGFPPSLNDKLRIQSNGGAVYLDAKEAFPVTRLELQNVENGEIIILDVSASAGKTVREPVKIVYDGEVATATASDKQMVSSNGDSTVRQSSAEAKPETRRFAKLSAPLPVVLTRYAAQNMYGPSRTVEPVPGISPVSLKLPSRITTIMPSEPVSVTPMAAWSLQGSSVIALQVRNRSAGKVILDSRVLEGQFTTATFQHRWLGRAGTPEDTTVLYLVTTGRPESAFIAELPLPATETGKGSKRSNQGAHQ
ncbi:TIGR03749 family integrating conjugative element protein [Citrobacter koseri]|uniref:TIGR03749 family integrating conjugative element protein n=1 Tax=Citrobacter koseri TaxID=545 RepID=UPI001FCCAD84|nr:TIGR03749 family integrating conjugative element protein [Citrobacter koseri]MDM9067042.1 TIGR03749 family integrating conjugative element protein [Citrobacter koseri]MDM9081500.1 TIGR03749 family integrating conjugative element protein [Citrobacter koseri]MDM9090113.1 TIGR03749 family integrating conjugative element protein [Citrobacter koseri]MDM9095518.1 TIGR03749 family integrating conjugative element protein [Citrobacter koseri]MDM9269865.1 TIGR03749 family integrating conjugative elem